jgi:hypothetical protein
MTMLRHLNLLTVKAIIDLAEALQAAEFFVPAKVPVVDQIFEEDAPWAKVVHHIERGMMKLIDSLPLEARAELLALMWVGRDGGDFRARVDQAMGQADQGGCSVYMIGKQPLATYLKDGLTAIGL